MSTTQGLGWRTGSENYCDASWQSSGGTLRLDVTINRGKSCRTPYCGKGKLSNGANRFKKTGMTSRKIEYWVIPSKENGSFVAAMENILETYKT